MLHIRVPGDRQAHGHIQPSPGYTHESEVDVGKEILEG